MANFSSNRDSTVTKLRQVVACLQVDSSSVPFSLPFLSLCSSCAQLTESDSHLLIFDTYSLCCYKRIIVVNSFPRLEWWLPLLLDDQHAARALPLLKGTIAALAANPRRPSPTRDQILRLNFSPLDTLKVSKGLILTDKCVSSERPSSDGWNCVHVEKGTAFPTRFWVRSGPVNLFVLAL